MPTALDFIHAIAEELGEYGSGVTTDLGTTTSLICSQFANSTLTPTEFDGMTVLIESGACAGQVGSLRTLTRGTGAISTGNAFTTAIVAGVTFSFYRLLPPKRIGVTPGLLEIAGQALREYIWLERLVTLTGVSGQKRYSLSRSLYPWLSDRNRIIEIAYPSTTSDDVTLTLNGSDWDWESDGETITLIFPSAPFKTGESIAIRAYAPANARLKLNATAYSTLTAGAVTALTLVTGGYYTLPPTATITGGGGTGATVGVIVANNTVVGLSITNAGSGYTTAPEVVFTRNASDTGWANQTSQNAGLLSLADEAVSDVSDVKTVGLYLAYRALAAMQAPGADVSEWLAKAEMWKAEAHRLEHVGEPSNLRTGVAVLRPVTVGGRTRRIGWSR